MKKIIEHAKESRVRPMPFVKDVFMCKMICFPSLFICVDGHHISLLFSLPHVVGGELQTSHTYSDDDN